MAAQQQRSLPALPRELRNRIYLYAGAEQSLTTADQDELPSLVLARGLNLGLLRTCKQVIDEYAQE